MKGENRPMCAWGPAQRLGVWQRLGLSSRKCVCDSDILAGEKSSSLLSSKWCAARVLWCVWRQLSPSHSTARSAGPLGRPTACSGQESKSPAPGQTLHKRSTGHILSILGGRDRHSKRKRNVQMNILKNFHLSFYEISALGIFYHANQALFSHFKKKICKNYYNPGRLNF